MSNLNPALIYGQAIAWLDRSGGGDNVRPHDRERITLRVYELTGSGYYFLRGYGANRWYYDEDDQDGHFNTCAASDVEAAINAGGAVQLCGSRGESLGLWPSWNKFLKAVKREEKK